MSTGEVFCLVLTIGAFTSFGVVLAYVTHLEAQAHRLAAKLAA